MNKSRHWSLAYDKDLSEAIGEMQTQSISEKMALLVKAAKLLTEDFLDLPRTTATI